MKTEGELMTKCTYWGLFVGNCGMFTSDSYNTTMETCILPHVGFEHYPIRFLYSDILIHSHNLKKNDNNSENPTNIARFYMVLYPKYFKNAHVTASLQLFYPAHILVRPLWFNSPSLILANLLLLLFFEKNHPTSDLTTYEMCSLYFGSTPVDL